MRNLAAFEPIGDHATDQDEENHRCRLDGPDDRERGWRVPEVVDLPGDGDHEEPVADQRDRPAGPEQREVALPKRLEDP
jgi:hypothetical protein